MRRLLRKKCFPFLIIGISFLIPFSAFGQIKAKVTATQAMLDSVCGTHAIKLVFTCQNLLWYVDFFEPTPQLRQMSGVASPYYPVISSDGRWVAYQTGLEFEGPSSSTLVGKPWMRELAVIGAPVQIADTGYVPRFVQNTSPDSPEIVYATSLACPQMICYNAGKTMKRKVINKAVAAPVLVSEGSYYGGLSWDNRYLNTGWEGGPNGFMLDLQDQAAGSRPTHTMRTLKVKTVASDPDTFNMVPVGTCNTSRSASRVFTNTMLFFDFGSGTISSAKCYHPLLGTWLVHEKLFISRLDGEDLQVFSTPADRPTIPVAQAVGTGEAISKAWDNPEWSNHPYFGVANLIVERIFRVNTAWERTKNHESIYLLDLKDSTYVKLVETTDTAVASASTFLYPFVWVEVPAAFKEDSTWLAKTIWEKAGVPVSGVPTIGVKRFPIVNHGAYAPVSLWANAKATRIVVYSVLGQELASVTKTAHQEINPEKFLNRLRSGIYFIGIESQGQKRQIVRWVSTRQ
jgi:hypothetical protein